MFNAGPSSTMERHSLVLVTGQGVARALEAVYNYSTQESSVNGILTLKTCRDIAKTHTTNTSMIFA